MTSVMYFPETKRNLSDSARMPSSSEIPLEHKNEDMGHCHKTSTNANLRHLFAFSSRRHAAVVAMAISISACAAAAKALYAVILGKIMDIVALYGAGHINQDTAMSGVGFWCIVLAVGAVATWILDSAYMFVWVLFGEVTAKATRMTLFAKLLRMPMAWFDTQEQGKGSSLSRIQLEIRELQIATSQVFGLLVYDTLVAIGCMAVAFYYSWHLTLVLVATVPLSITFLSLITRGLETAIDSQKSHLARASKCIATAMTAIDHVKVYNGFDNEVWQYMQIVSQISGHFMQQAWRHALQIGYFKLWLVSLFVIGFWFAVFLVSECLTTAGRALAAFYACLSAFQAMEGLQPQWLVLARGCSAGHSLRKIVLEMAKKSRDDPHGKPLIHPEECTGHIELCGVSFAYPSNPDRVVLSPSSICFQAGKLTFLVGRSGSGKSTLGNLISKLYRPGSGKILLDGNPLETLDDDWVRRNVTFIQQSSLLLNDSVLMNVALGSHDPLSASREDVTSACGTAMMRWILADLPDGLDTNIGMGGYELSGGQEQWLAIAQAKLRDPTVLILDEITSGLDPVTKAYLLEDIRTWRAGKTTIIITHDVSQINSNDLVYVMDRGSIAQDGFRQALDKDHTGIFASLVALNAGSLRCEAIASSYEGTMKTDNRIHPPQAPAVAELHREKETTELNHTNILIPQTAHSGERPCFDEIHLREMAASQSQGTICTGLAKTGKIQENGVSTFKILGTIWPLLDTKDRARMMIGTSSCLVASACTPAFSYAFARLLAAFWAPSRDMSTDAMIWAVRLSAIAVVDGFALFSAYYLMQYVGENWVALLRVEAFKRILSQPRHWFNKPHHSQPRIMDVLNRNAEQTRDILGRFLPILLMVVGSMMVALVWSFAICWKLTIATLAWGPIIYATTKINASFSLKWETRSKAAAKMAESVAADTFLNIKAVRGLNLEDYFATKHANSAKQAFTVGLKRASCAGAYYGLNQSISWWLTAFVLWYAMILVASPGATASVTGIMQVINLLLFSIGSAKAMLDSIPQTSQMKASAVQLLYYATLSYGSSHDIYREKKIHTPLPVEMRALNFGHPAFQCQNKGAAYACSVNVLKNVDLKIRNGEFVAVVGASGSGKSTLANMLLRLHEPCETSGLGHQAAIKQEFSGCCTGKHADHQPASLTYAHIPAQELSTPALRGHMAFVPQHAILLPATIYENIVYGLHPDSPYRDLSAVVEAAKFACIHEFIISLPNGYHTFVGEGGMGLSRGQAQRLSIATALVRKPKLLVMDEPTSALDAESAARVRTALKGLLEHRRGNPTSEDMTVVVVTHSKEMMMTAGRIVVMDHGTVAEDGEYNELLAQGGKLAELVGDGKGRNPCEVVGGRSDVPPGTIGSNSLLSEDTGRQTIPDMQRTRTVKRHG